MSEFVRNLVNKLCGPHRPPPASARTLAEDPASQKITLFLQRGGHTAIVLVKASKSERVFVTRSPEGQTLKVIALSLAKAKKRRTTVAALDSLFADFRDLTHPAIAPYRDAFYQDDMETYFVVLGNPPAFQDLSPPATEMDYKRAVFAYLLLVREKRNTQILESVVLGAQSVRLAKDNSVKFDHILAEEVALILGGKEAGQGLAVEGQSPHSCPIASVKNILFEAIVKIKVSEGFIAFVKFLEYSKGPDTLLGHPFFADLRASHPPRQHSLRVVIPNEGPKRELADPHPELLLTGNSVPQSKLTSPTFHTGARAEGFSSAPSLKSIAKLQKPVTVFPDAPLPTDQRIRNPEAQPGKLRVETVTTAEVAVPPANFSRRTNRPEGLSAVVSPTSKAKPGPPPDNRSLVNREYDQGPFRISVEQVRDPSPQTAPLLSQASQPQKMFKSSDHNRLSEFPRPELRLDSRRASATAKGPVRDGPPVPSLVEVRETKIVIPETVIQDSNGPVKSPTPNFPGSLNNSVQPVAPGPPPTQPSLQSARVIQESGFSFRNQQLRTSVAHEVHSSETIELDPTSPYHSETPSALTAPPTPGQPQKENERTENKSILKTGKRKSQSRVRFSENLTIFSG